MNNFVSSPHSPFPMCSFPFMTETFFFFSHSAGRMRAAPSTPCKVIPAIMRKDPRKPYSSMEYSTIGGRAKDPAVAPAQAIPAPVLLYFEKYWLMITGTRVTAIPTPKPNNDRGKKCQFQLNEMHFCFLSLEFITLNLVILNT